MNIHKIQSHLHHSFLEEERKDSITGDLIQANDEVVFCGVCKSVFLKDSWKFMNSSHCGQKNTLKDFPIARQLLLNVPVINPVFITPLLSSFSMKEWKEDLSEFDVEDKKAMVYHKSNFIADWQNSKPALPQVKKQTFKKTYRREPVKEIAPLSYLKKLKRRIKGQKKRIKNYIDDHRDNKIWFLDSQPLVGLSVLFNVFALMITLFPAISSPEIEVSSLILQSILILCVCPMLYIMYQFTEVTLGHLKQKVTLLFSTKSESISLPKRLNPIVEEINNNNVNASHNNVNILFGIIENKFFLYNENNKLLSFHFNKYEITIFHISDKQVSLQLKTQKGGKTFFSLIFFSKRKMSEFLLTLAKQKNHFMDTSKINLIDFPPNKEKYLKKNLKNYKEFIFVKPTPSKKENKEYTEKMTLIQLENTITPIDLTKVTKSQKKSKQSKNRNRHHQNQHQTQYRNHKRR